MRRPRLLLPAAELLGAAALFVGGALGHALAATPPTSPPVDARVRPAAAAADSADDPRIWLARTDEALATRNYRGVFVHEYGGQTETLRIVQRVGSDGLSERLQSMDGSGREFIRRGTQLLCYLPDRHMVLVEHSDSSGLLLGGLSSLEAALAGEYVVTQIARTRVSGRMARVIGIEPRDQLRYGYRVWIDEATAMPLRMQLRDAHGHALEQIVFTDLALPAHISPMELVPTVDAHNYRWVQQDVPAPAGHSQSALAISWQASSLPPGFHMTASARQMLPGGPAEHLVFSDGLASVSVFVQVRGHAGMDAGGSTHDDTASLGTSSAYSIAVQGYRITVVGEVPPQTVRDIAQAMRAVPPAAMAESSFGVPAPRSSGQGAAAADLDAPVHSNGFAGTDDFDRMGFGAAAPAGAHFAAGAEHRR